MKKIQKLLLSVCLLISLMFGCFAYSIPVYAVGNVWDSAQSYAYFESHFDDINTRLNGVIINQDRLQESFEDYLQEFRENYNIPSGTTTNNWIGDNISGTYQNGSSGVSDLSISLTLRQAMRDWCNVYLDANTGFYYRFSQGTAEYLNLFTDQDMYHAFLDFVSLHDTDSNTIIQFKVFSNDDVRPQYLILKTYNDTPEYVFSQSYSGLYTNAGVYVNWSQSNIGYTQEYVYNSNTQTYESTGTQGNQSTSAIFIDNQNQSFSNWSAITVNLNRTKYLVYKSFNSMKAGSEGVQEYYTTDSYNSSITDSYNTTTSNIENTIGSNNVNNYINNYYVENGSYPTPNQVSIYINNYTGDNNGSGSDGSSDDDNGHNFDWGFLGTIGDFLGGLLSGISGVISGLLEGITGIIDLFIGSENAETGQREGGLPSIIGQLLNYFLPFLPSEILTLIELSIVLALIIGVVKLIRGS